MKEVKPNMNAEIVTENEKPEKEKFEKPPIDLFKSIFLADSSSEDDSNDESEVPEKSSEKSSENPKKALFGSELSPDSDAPPKPWEVKKPENVLRNPNPPKGIFANVDFDRLNSKKVIAPKPPIKPTMVEEVKKTSERYISTYEYYISSRTMLLHKSIINKAIFT